MKDFLIEKIFFENKQIIYITLLTKHIMEEPNIKTIANEISIICKISAPLKKWTKLANNSKDRLYRLV